jgi:hypothetical protein
MHNVEKGTVFYNQWYRIGLFNLLLVATIGLLLRYKIVASLPWVNHKYFLHGHSHFAFSGWVSLIIMVGILQRIHTHSGQPIIKKFKPLLWLHLLAAYGMLVSFPIQGYGLVSISFSTLSILISYAFVWMAWKNCNVLTWGSKTAALSIKAALIFLVISSFGAFWLATLMATHSGAQSQFFTALYSFLHFQYNGWFFFGILGFCLTMLPSSDPAAKKGLHKGVIWMVAACAPAVALSALWMKVPAAVYAIAIAAAIMQLGGVIIAWKSTRKGISILVITLSTAEKWLLGLSGGAFLIRVVLQALSTIPALSKFAFAYRPIVIGYLHLILLGCITLFLFSFLYGKNLWRAHARLTHVAFILFIAGFLGTEGTLMLQGFGYIGWINIPYTNEVLFASALFLFSGAAMLFATARTKTLS